MFNAQLPNMSELPTSRQLVRSTLIAAAGAAAILAMVILPAEYGIDPTGVGRVLGLTEMGEIKTQLAGEAAADRASAGPPVTIAAAGAAAAPATIAQPAAGAERRDRMELVLAPGQGAEIKVTAAQGARVAFDWTVSGGRVNYDTHGDPVNKPRGFYHGYGNGKASTGERGTLVAAFDGTHGWFWRNRSDQSVTVVLRTGGGYTDIKRVV